MDRMSYKSFVWPQNPEVYQEEVEREAQYVTKDGVTTYTGMGELKRHIRSSGVFYGENAFAKFQALAKLAEESTPGNLEHPVWGIRYCYLTGLEMTQEPGEERVSYSVSFTGALSNGEVPK